MRLRLLWSVVGIVAAMVSTEFAADNELTPKEKGAGWILLFDGKTLDGWKTSSEQPSQRQVEEASINPHKCGGYMMIHEKQWSDFILSLDFKISKACNSGIFIRTSPLKPRPGKDVGFNGMEIAIDDTLGCRLSRHRSDLRLGKAQQERHETSRRVEPYRDHQ